MKSLRRIWAIVKKEGRQLRRDRLTFGMIVGIPTLLLVLFGYAINMDPRHLPAAVADLALTSASRAQVMTMAHTQVIDIVAVAGSAEELETMIRRGEIKVGIYLPPDFDRRMQQRDRAAMQILVDGSDTVVQGAVQQIGNSTPRSAYFDLPPDIEIRTLYNPERRSAVNTVPGLVGVILTMTMILFTAVAIVRERERGNLELLIATPVRPYELMLAKILPYVVIGLIQVSVILGLGWALFDVPMRGMMVDIYLVSLVFILANLALGLVISTLATSQFQAMQLTYFILLPSILMSGFMFPFEGMPKVAQWIAEGLPMTHFMRLIRGVILRGADLADLSREVMILGGFIIVAMTLAVMRFTKRLD